MCCSFRTIEKGSHKWEERRRRRLITLAPAWGEAGKAARGRKPSKGCGRVAKAATKLVRQVQQGNAWQADHIVPVYMGGGLCDIDNLRTLCTLCHQVRLSLACALNAA